MKNNELYESYEDHENTDYVNEINEVLEYQKINEYSTENIEHIQKEPEYVEEFIGNSETDYNNQPIEVPNPRARSSGNFTITNPSFNGQTVPLQNLAVRWNPVSGATYRLSLRNINTNVLLISNQQINGTTFTLLQNTFVAGHQYRVAVSARVGNGHENWAERTFFAQSSTASATLTVNISSWNPGSSASNGSFTITTNQAINSIVSLSTSNWLTVSGTGATRNMSVTANTSTSPRNAIITVRTSNNSITRNISVTQAGAVQNFTVTFNSNGGTPTPATRSIRSGLTVGTLPTNPTRSGFTFMGWFNTSAATGGTHITANTVVSSNMTAWARWVQNFTVTFNANGGTPTPATRSIRSGLTVGTLPANPTRSGFTFMGWFNTSAATGGTQITANTVVSGNITAWARWTQNFTVTFNSNGGTPTPAARSIRSGLTVGTLPANPTRSGFTFMGWFNTSAATGGTQITANTVVSGNITAWARWTQNFTVTFNSNGGTPTPATRSIRSGLTVGTLPANPTRSGFTFMGWFNTSAATGGTQITANTVVSSNMTAWARWNQQVVQNRTVTFNPNGGTPTPANRTVPNGGQLGALPTVTRSNHSFNGWWTAASSGSQVTATTIVTSNLNLFARWNQQWDITNPANDGDVLERQTFNVRWNAVSGANYRVAMRNLTTNVVVFDNVNNGTSTSFQVTVGQLTAGHSYRIAVGATVNEVTNWRERIFSVRGNQVQESFIWPVTAGRPTVTQGFHSSHGGIDIQNQRHANYPDWTTPPGDSWAQGNPIVAARSGIIVDRIVNSSTAGNGFVIAHGGGYFTRYLHLHNNQFLNMGNGASVSRGTTRLGLVGITGSTQGSNNGRSNGHLHFEIIFVEGRSNTTAEDDALFLRNADLRNNTTGVHNNHTWWKHNPAHYLPQLLNNTVFWSLGLGNHHNRLRNP